MRLRFAAPALAAASALCLLLASLNGEPVRPAAAVPAPKRVTLQGDKIP
jgi:hypothetical protein